MAGAEDSSDSPKYRPMSDEKGQFVRVGAEGGQAVTMLQDGLGPVGLMIAGNFVSPGGSCMQWVEYELGLWSLQFVADPGSRKQQESALSFIVHENEAVHAAISEKLSHGTIGKYRMKPPKGDETDFLVFDGSDETGGKEVDCQTAPPDLYGREYGFWVPNYKRPGPTWTPKEVYLSFVAGPNANMSILPSTWPDPRETDGGWDDLDGRYRTCSLNAWGSYRVFKNMVRTALRASLESMTKQTPALKRVIIAALSCGLDAGPDYKRKIREEYPDLCREVIQSIHDDIGYTFDEVIIPTFFADGSLYGPCPYGAGCRNKETGCLYTHPLQREGRGRGHRRGRGQLAEGAPALVLQGGMSSRGGKTNNRFMV